MAWWKTWASEKTELQRVGIVYSSFPCGSSDVERVASAVKFVHSDARNRLSHAKVQMLVSVMWNLRLLDDIPEDSWDSGSEESGSDNDDNEDA